MSRFRVVADNRRAIDFVQPRLDINMVQGMTGICLLRDEEVIAACVYHDFNGSNVFMHCCGAPGTRWLNRDFLHWCFHYPFEQLHANRVTVWVTADNLTSLRFVRHLGFQSEATLKGAGPAGVDAEILVLFRKDCRYVEEGFRRNAV